MKNITKLFPNIILLFTGLSVSIVSGATPAPKHQVIFVSLPNASSWQDFALLASVPASRVANKGNGAVIALEDSGKIPLEVQDYLKRLKPASSFHLGEKALTPSPLLGKNVEIPCSSADQAANALASTFWKSSQRVVVCPEDDYASALLASTLAGRLRIPLLFSNPKGLSTQTAETIKSLKAQELLFVGKSPEGLKSTKLPDIRSILLWMKRQGLKTPYLALTNVRDRSNTTIHKLSLAAPLFAAAHDGMVVPIDNDIRWRVPFNGKPIDGEKPVGIPNSSKPPKAGVIELPEGKVPFIVSYGANDKKLLSLDLDGNGKYDGANEKPLTSNGVVTLLGKPRTLNFGRNEGINCDLTVTTGRAEDINEQLRKLYSETGIPRFLCIVGFPDSIPQAIITRGDADITSDLPYANADDDIFSEIGVGRIIAESATFATLHASRTITYNALLEPEWDSRAGQARWENTMSYNFQNVGLDTTAYHDIDNLPWINPPSKGKNGERSPSISQDSPLTNVAFISHTDHSWWKELGHTYFMNSNVLLAPSVVESGGCSTCTLDNEPNFNSVVSRLFRNGAISFCGQTRPGIAQQEQQRAEFWNSIFNGKTLGEAHRNAQNSKASLVTETGQLTGGSDHYQLHIRSLFGDPAFKPHLPSLPKSAPAKIMIKNDIVSVLAPAKWWKVQMKVPEDWKIWVDKPLYVIRGAGTYPNRYWCSEQYDSEETFTNVEFTTKRKIKSITQSQIPQAPLGWTGKHTVDKNPNGTTTYRWRVRLIDFDQKTGEIKSQLRSIDYLIEYE